VLVNAQADALESSITQEGGEPRKDVNKPVMPEVQCRPPTSSDLPLVDSGSVVAADNQRHHKQSLDS
jgi:hypothetical protein